MKSYFVINVSSGMEKRVLIALEQIAQSCPYVTGAFALNQFIKFNGEEDTLNKYLSLSIGELTDYLYHQQLKTMLMQLSHNKSDLVEILIAHRNKLNSELESIRERLSGVILKSYVLIETLPFLEMPNELWYHLKKCNYVARILSKTPIPYEEAHVFFEQYQQQDLDIVQQILLETNEWLKKLQMKGEQYANLEN